MTHSFGEFQIAPDDLVGVVKELDGSVSDHVSWYYHDGYSLVDDNFVPPYLRITTRFVCTRQGADFTVSEYRGSQLNRVWKIEDADGRWFQYVEITNLEYIEVGSQYRESIQEELCTNSRCCYVVTTSEANQKFFEEWYAMRLLLKSS